MRPGLDPSGCSINLQDSKDLVRDEASLGLAPSQTSPTEGKQSALSDRKLNQTTIHFVFVLIEGTSPINVAAARPLSKFVLLSG